MMEQKYRCPFCSSREFIGHQIIRADIVVGETGEFKRNLEGGLEPHIYDSERPYGPFTCTKCGEEFDELPVHERTDTPRGTFIVAKGEVVLRFKEKGYGYHHESKTHVIVGNGRRAVAITQDDYRKYYGGAKSFML